ncbi:hypothetical protein [Kitasatospora sp. NPDC088134]|uniref:hypothetical protein n=1 Tax=Kitasatospora sp. NPDC088134 TaxID=3364071 RepID=UPI0038299A58
MLAAQVWGLGLGATGARAADGPVEAGRRGGGTVRAEERGLLDRAAPGPDGTAEAAGTPVPGGAPHPRLAPDELPELPLPGHRADGPDAFALAARLLAGIPAQPRAEEAGRASRSGPANGRPGETEPLVPAQRAPAAATPAPPAPPPASAPPTTPTGSPRPAPTTAPPPATPTRPAPAAPTRLALTTAAAPTHPSDTEDAVAVLLPIAAGLLLTATAMYKHRGLPGGH